ncbi:MAG: hypothetical protein ACR2JQ_03690 [Mycobacteriales bacterium]
MSIGWVAFHYPKPEYRDDMIRRVHAAAQVLIEVPGCPDVHCWETVEIGAIVASGRWESNEARQAGFAAAREAGVDFDYDDRQLRPWEVFHLSPV